MKRKNNSKRYVLSPLGTYGDIRPMLALGKHLQKRGHDVVLVLTKDYAAKCGSYDLPLTLLDVDYEGAFFKKTAKGKYKQLSSMHIIRSVNRFIDAQFGILNSILKENDIVISNSFGYAAVHAAEAKNIQAYHIIYCSQLLPSSDYSPFYFPVKTANPFINRILWKLMLGLSDIVGRKPINAHRKALGLPAVRQTYSYHLGRNVVLATDAEVDPVSASMQYAAPQVGYMHFYDDTPPNAEIERMLDTGKHKVYFGLGSMVNNDSEKILEILERLGKELNIRFFMGGKVFQEEPDVSGSDIIYPGHVSHLHLFPEMSAVIHHGGSGTTHTAALCGVPQIIMPVLMDQPAFAAHIYKNGLGPKPLNRKKIRYESFRKALAEVLGNREMQEKCWTLALQLKKRRNDDYAFLRMPENE